MKNKICIVTWYSSHNCGTCLQARALNDALKKNNKVNMLSYNRSLSLFNFDDIKILVRKVIKKLGHKNKTVKTITVKPDRKLKIQHFIDDSFNLVDLPKSKIKFENQFDYFVVGSDQLWNPFWFDEKNFLYFVRDSRKKLSYATSIGISTIPDNYKKRYCKYLSSFSHINVREEKAKELLTDIVKRNDISVVSDPTFLLTKNEWKDVYYGHSQEKINNDKYLLCYFVGGIKEYEKQIKKFAADNELKIYIIPMREEDYEIKDVCFKESGPYEFLDLIDHSEYVFTDSFHASTISLIFNKKFFVNKRINTQHNLSQGSRIEELLKRFHIENIFNNNDINVWNSIDYQKINSIINRERDYSLGILYKMIGDNYEK